MIRTATHSLTFRTREEKAAYMERGAARDARSPRVRQWAARFAGLAPWPRARAVLRFVQLCIDYEKDPGEEVLESSNVGLERGLGDCDVKSRLFVALCLATGLEAELEPVFRGDDGFPHVRARVRLDGRWYVADPSIVNSDVGRLPDTPPITNYYGRFRGAA